MFAMKVFDRQKLKGEQRLEQRMGMARYGNSMELVLNEILILGGLSHKNVIGLIEVIDSAFNVVEYLQTPPLYMVLEFASRGESLTWQPEFNRYVIPGREGGRYTEEEIQRVMKGATNGLGYRRVISARERHHPPRH